MGFGQRRKFLVRGVARSIRRIEGLGRSFRVLVKKDGDADHLTVEAETLEPASDAEIATLSAKLLDALAGEMSDVVREAEASDRVTLRLVQPGTLPRLRAGKGPRLVVPRRMNVH